MMSLVPGFGAVYVPAPYRIGLSIVMSFLLAPSIAQYVPALPKSTMLLFLILTGEVIVGAFMGAIGLVAMSALQAAGTFIAYFASMANALVQDSVSNQQSSVVSGFLGTMGVVLVFVTDLHHVVLRALVDSFSLFQPGQPLMFGDMSNVMARHVSDAFMIGLKLSSPLLLAALVYYFSLGVLGRLMPTLQVFFFGLPVQISIQIWVFLITLSGMMMVFLEMFSDFYAPFVIP